MPLDASSPSPRLCASIIPCCSSYFAIDRTYSFPLTFSLPESRKIRDTKSHQSRGASQSSRLRSLAIMRRAMGSGRSDRLRYQQPPRRRRRKEEDQTRTVETRVGEERLLGELGVDRVQRAIRRPGKLHATFVCHPVGGLLGVRRTGAEGNLLTEDAHVSADVAVS
jgi:hypothetical protein